MSAIKYNNDTVLHCVYEQEYIGFADDTLTCRLQASLTLLGGVFAAGYENEFS